MNRPKEKSTPPSARAALYGRVSTTGQTADNQLLALRSFAAGRGWAVTEYVDHGVSGAREKRPQLDALLAAARARTIDVVVCVKLDRLARSVSHLMALAKEFAELGVDLVVLDQAIDTTTPSGRLLFHILASVAEFERDLIRDRVVAGVKRARAQGQWLGGVPLGSKLEAGRLVPDLDGQQIVAEILKLRREGLTERAIAGRVGRSKNGVHTVLDRRGLVVHHKRPAAAQVA